MLLIKHMLPIALALHAGSAFPGSPAGPYLAWVNLHQDSKPQTTSVIRSHTKLEPDDEFCGEPTRGWIIYIQRRPNGLTNELIRSAVDRRDTQAVHLIVKRLLTFRDSDIGDGLDGVIAYTETKFPHMTSIDTHKKIKSSKIINDPRDPRQVLNAFCEVIPEVYRK